MGSLHVITILVVVCFALSSNVCIVRNIMKERSTAVCDRRTSSKYAVPSTCTVRTKYKYLMSCIERVSKERSRVVREKKRHAMSIPHVLLFLVSLLLVVLSLQCNRGLFIYF